MFSFYDQLIPAEPTLVTFQPGDLSVEGQWYSEVEEKDRCIE